MSSLLSKLLLCMDSEDVSDDDLSYFFDIPGEGAFVLVNYLLLNKPASAPMRYFASSTNLYFSFI